MPGESGTINAKERLLSNYRPSVDVAPGMMVAHSHLALAGCRANAGALTLLLGCSPSNPAVGTALSTFFLTRERKARMLGEAWREQMQYQGTAAAWAADVGPVGGRSPVGGAVPAEGWKAMRIQMQLAHGGAG